MLFFFFLFYSISREMDYVGKLGNLITSLNNFYNEINPATLSGAIDIIVVEQPDGELASSPFHVRFGKLSLLLPQEKKVWGSDMMTELCQCKQINKKIGL